MVSLYKRGGIWWIRFTTPDGRELRETAATTDRRQAQEYHDTRKAELWRQAKLGERPRHTWKVRAIDPLFGTLYLDQINREQVDRLIRTRQQAGNAPATINRHTALVRSILNHAAKQWGWLDTAPHTRMLAEPSRRIRWLTREEADQLIVELPPHLAAMARFSLATGLREMNVVTMEWNQVDLEQRRAWIHADQSKSRRALAVHLNAEAVCVLREQWGNHPERVFTFRGQPVTRANNHAWRKALQQAGIENFRWHDLRHTWASWHVQAGTPLNVLQELGGWSSLAMVLRYAHLSAAHLAEHAERIARPRVIRTNPGTAEKKALANGG